MDKCPKCGKPFAGVDNIGDFFVFGFTVCSDCIHLVEMVVAVQNVGEFVTHFWDQVVPVLLSKAYQREGVIDPEAKEALDRLKEAADVFLDSTDDVIH